MKKVLIALRRCSSLRCPSLLTASRPPSLRPTPSSADRGRRCRLQACIAARCGAPSGSAPISVIADFIQSLERPRSARPLTEPVGAAVGEVGAGIAPSTAAQVGAAAGEVGVGIVLSTAVPDHSVAAAGVGAAAGERPVGAAAGVGGGSVIDERIRT